MTRLPTHSVKHFTRCAAADKFGSRVWATEISELPRPVCGLVHDDACDLGFAVHNTDTGITQAFRQREEIKNADGEVEVWIFEPVDTRLRATGMEFHLIND